MPKVSKVSVPKSKRVVSKPGDPPPPKVTLDKFRCVRCGQIYKRQKYNFSPSRSPIYAGNDGYLPICTNCLEDLAVHYKTVLKSEAAAIQRICMKFDIYWSPDVYAMISKGHVPPTKSKIREYMSRVNLIQFADKTYDDTLDELEKKLELDSKQQKDEQKKLEMKIAMLAEQVAGSQEKKDEDAEPVVEDDGEPIPQEVIDFWGTGFDKDYYRYVQSRYDVWTKDVEKPMPVSTEALYKQICDTEAIIVRRAMSGADTDKPKATLINLLGALNEKPSQKQQQGTDSADEEFEKISFGMGIRMCETMRPIPKPDPEYNDVDGIVRYITIWFLGHLCKMLGIKNTYCKMYEEEMERLRVEREISPDEDDDAAFDEIFGSDAGGDW